MNEFSELNKKINDLRDHLHVMILNKENIQDREILEVSKMIDYLLNEYSKLLEKKK